MRVILAQGFWTTTFLVGPFLFQDNRHLGRILSCYWTHFSIFQHLACFGCQLLGYMSRTVRSSVSYNNAKRTNPVREKEQNICDHWPQGNELIKQIRKQMNPPKKSASETREPLRSHVINGAQKKGGSAQRSHWVRDTGDKRRIRSRRRKHR